MSAAASKWERATVRVGAKEFPALVFISSCVDASKPSPSGSAEVQFEFPFVGEHTPLLDLAAASGTVFQRSVIEWSGTATQLREAMLSPESALRPDQRAEVPSPEWIGRRLADGLRRSAPNVEYVRYGRARMWRLRRLE